MSVWSRVRLSLRRSLRVDPANVVGTERLSQPAIVEQVRATRGYSPAMPADEWSDDITKQNAQITADYNAEVARRTALQLRGEYVPRFGSVENDLVFEMRTANVTALVPRLQQLTPLEYNEAREISRLESELAVKQPNAVDRPALERPSRADVMAACGGDIARAAAVLEKLDALFGPEAANG